MTRGAYFECFAGASGDMVLGALIDAGWAEEDFRAALAAIPLGGWRADVRKVKKGALRATQVRLVAEEPQPERDVRDINRIIEASALPDPVKARAIALFAALADVEGLEHDQPPETVHFHEVGAVDSILDIVGACAGLHALGIERLFVSPINVGGGIVPTRDGILPVPGPAALELLRRKGAPIYASEYGPEFLTPTGALVLATLADGFGPFPPMRVEQIGYGAGQKDFQIPNVVRLSIGELGQGWEARRRGAVSETGAGRTWLGPGVAGAASPTATADSHTHEDADEQHAHGHTHGGDRGHEHSHGHALLDQEDVPGEEDVVVQLETNVDNMNPEWYGYVSERLFAGGALDVTLAPVYMKKGRPGTLVSVLVTPDQMEPALDTLFAETTTLGVRVNHVLRRKLERRVEAVETPYGRVRVKLSVREGQIRAATPEYDDCRALALEQAVPLGRVYAAAQAAAGLTSPENEG